MTDAEAVAGGARRGGVPFEIRIGLWLPPFAWGALVAACLVAGALLFRFAAGRVELGHAPASLGFATRAALVAALSFGYTLAIARWVAIGVHRDHQELGLVDPGRDPRRDEAAIHWHMREDLVRSRWAGLAGIVLFVATVEVPTLLAGGRLGSAWVRLHALSYMLLLGVAFFWVAGRTAHASLAQPTPTGRALAEVVPVDFLDLRALRVASRGALRGSLAWVGGFSLGSLVLLNPELRFRESLIVFVPLLLVTAAVATGSLFLPLRGLRRRIAERKREELSRVDAALRGDRTGLAGTRIADRAGELGLADLIAYRRLVEDVPEWPLEGRSLSRLGLYLLIPLASWVGAALVERVVNLLVE